MKNALSLILSFASALCLYQGFNKMFRYSNSDSVLYEKVNAYVAGDAYNYIINSNLSASYFVLAAFFGLAAIGIRIITTIENKNQEKETSNE